MAIGNHYECRNPSFLVVIGHPLYEEYYRKGKLIINSELLSPCNLLGML